MIPLLELSGINYSYHELTGETIALENICSKKTTSLNGEAFLAMCS